MKKIIIGIIAILSTITAHAQFWQTDPSQGKYFQRIKVINSLIIPVGDTMANQSTIDSIGSIIYRVQDNFVYIKTNTNWQKISIGSGINVRDSIQQLKLLSGNKEDAVIVKDSTNGGLFYWSDTGTPDSTTVFQAANGYWVRSRDLLNKIGYYRAPWPVEFIWRPFSIYRDAVGKWATSFDMNEFINQQVPGKPVQYVDYATGDDANTGTSPAQAKKSVNSAYSSGGRVIYLSSGIIDWNGFKTLTTDGSDLVLIGAGMDKTYITSNDTANNVFTLSSGTTYTTTRANIGGAFDYKYTNEDGYFIRHKNVNSLALCQSTPGSIYVTGSTVYVNLIDGRAPDANFKLQFDAQAALIQADAGKIIMKDLTFAGHRQGTYIRGTAESIPSTAQVYAYNCGFIYGLLESGLRVNNIAYCHSENCVGYGNGIDGFNYKSTANVNKMKIVEVNNKGYRNGLLNGINQNSVKNGSSAHDSLTIVRVGGTFYENAGPNVVDVGATTLSYNVGVNANNSKGYISVDPNGGNNDFLVSSPAMSISKMYLLDCMAFDSKVAIEARGGSQMYSINSLYPSGSQHIGNVTFLDSLPDSQQGTFSIASGKYNKEALQNSFIIDSLNASNLQRTTDRGNFTDNTIVLSGMNNLTAPPGTSSLLHSIIDHSFNIFNTSGDGSVNSTIQLGDGKLDITSNADNYIRSNAGQFDLKSISPDGIANLTLKSTSGGGQFTLWNTDDTYQYGIFSDMIDRKVGFAVEVAGHALPGFPHSSVGFIAEKDSVATRFISATGGTSNLIKTNNSFRFNYDNSSNPIGFQMATVANEVKNNFYKDGRISGSNAINTNEYITLGQANNNYIQNQFATDQSANLRITGVAITKSGFISNKGQNTEHYTMRVDNNTRWNIGITSTETGSGNIGSDFVLWRYTDAGSFIGQALLVSRSTGNVGIGTPTPGEKLEVNGNIKTSSTSIAGTFSNWSAPGAGGYVLSNPTGSARWVNRTTNAESVTDYAGGDWILERRNNAGAGAFTVMYMSRASGNVGISTASPSEKLEVNGNIKVSGTANIAGGAFTINALGQTLINATLGTTGVINANGGLDIGPLGGFRMQAGGAAGKTIVSDASGNGIWADVPASTNIGFYTWSASTGTVNAKTAGFAQFTGTTATTLTLTNPGAAGYNIFIKNKGTAAITLSPGYINLTNTTTTNIAQNQVVRIYFDGTNWIGDR